MRVAEHKYAGTCVQCAHLDHGLRYETIPWNTIAFPLLVAFCRTCKTIHIHNVAYWRRRRAIAEVCNLELSMPSAVVLDKIR